MFILRYIKLNIWNISLICGFHMYAISYEVYHHPSFLLPGLQALGQA
jgi:hypothetical protein